MRALLLASSLLLVGCVGVPVDRVTAMARPQTPQAGPDEAWSARGRLSLLLPGRIMSLTTYLRHSAGGELRVAMMDDGGLVVCDLSYGESGSVVHHCREELVAMIPVFATLFEGTYAPAATGGGEWRSGRLRISAGRWHRWYGGDPLLLRYVSGYGWPVEVGDYRVADGLLVAHQAWANGSWGAELRLELESVSVGEAPPP